eukprot:gb/GFBE01052150.1/.p1 GENE.gb/GFBE01052150.1/~~gb/GFBE01052150.1/.p1  ORF type:complete len:234 (+),score=39.68 gb/GFBE01052150.1/:1-702(+)
MPLDPWAELCCLKASIKRETEALERNPYGPSPEELVAEEKAKTEQLDRIMEASKKDMAKSASAPSIPVRSNTRPYRLPMPGEAVQMTGMRSRPHLNGARGEVVSTEADDEGFITVRVSRGSPVAQGRDAQAWRLMKVRPHRLLPLELDAIDPRIRAPPALGSDQASCRTCTTPNSLACSSHAASRASKASKASKASSRRSRRSVISHSPLPDFFLRQNVSDNSLTHLPTAVIL